MRTSSGKNSDKNGDAFACIRGEQIKKTNKNWGRKQIINGKKSN